MMKYFESIWTDILEKIHSSRKQNDREVVFVSERIKPRMAKIAYALQRNDYKVILILLKQSRADLDKLDQRYFEQIVFFSDIQDAYRKCLMYRPLVYHIFSEAHVSEWTEYLIANKHKLGKIVYDQYDAYRGFVTDKLDVYGKREKFCLENADGLCCRMFETQYLKQKYGYRFQGKRLLFLDYCWNRFHGKNSREEKHRHLRIIYGGRLLAASPSNRYKIEFRGLEYIAKTMQEDGDHLIIVPSKSCQNKGFRAYLNLSQKYGSLLIKEPMSFSKLIAYERHMDYGIDCIELREDIYTYCGKTDDFNMFAKNKYYATNKYFDYLDAGIMPLYGREQERFGRYLSYFGGAIHCTLEEMPEKLQELRKGRAENRRKACEAREALDIMKQIDRLLAFYREI